MACSTSSSTARRACSCRRATAPRWPRPSRAWSPTRSCARAGRRGRGSGRVSETRRIPVRAEDVWTFTERNVPLWDVLELFPKDAIGTRGPKDPPRPYDVRPITIETDLGWSFETDIQYG